MMAPFVGICPKEQCAAQQDLRGERGEKRWDFVPPNTRRFHPQQVAFRSLGNTRKFQENSRLVKYDSIWPEKSPLL